MAEHDIWHWQELGTAWKGAGLYHVTLTIPSRDYYKPSDGLFDSVAEGRVLILSPWEYDSSKRHVTRDECVAMNKMAEEICALSL